MKLKLILATAIAGAGLALPSVSGAAPPPPPPQQDSVVLTGAPAFVVTPSVFLNSTIFDLNATSGPSGENPSGLVRLDALGGSIHVGGPVTCLAVNGNTATITFLPQPPSNFTGTVTVQVVDDQPDTFDATPFRAPTDCSPISPTGLAGVLNNGDIKVVDAQPPPTTPGQCLNNGWKQFGFANQGLCLAFVNRS
jgi:hypothetical protein